MSGPARSPWPRIALVCLVLVAAGAGTLAGTAVGKPTVPALPSAAHGAPSSATALAPLPAPRAPARPAAVMLDGADVSSYQGTINWANANGSIQFAIAKAAEGTTCTDSDFANNIVNAPKNGIYIGAYDFAEIPSGADQYCPGGTDNASAEATYFDSIAGPYFTAGYIYPALDFEQACAAEGDGSYTPQEESHWIGMWMATVQAYILAKDNITIEPLIYMGSAYAANCIEPWITQFPLWVANWGVSSPGLGLYSSWAFWQYNDDCTTCGSANGGDADYFNGGVTYLLDHYVFGTAGPAPPTASYAMHDNNTGAALSCGGTFAVGDQIEYTATASGGTAPYNYSWAFGDGTVGFGATVSHIFTRPGTIDSMLTVTDAKGLNASTGAGCSFTVTGSLLTATATASPTSGTAPLAVAFSGTATGGSGTYASWFWSFGDGSHASTQSPSHTYTSPGTYAATVTVNDSAKHTATSVPVSITVSSSSSLAVSGTESATSGSAPLSVSFTSTATGGTGGYAYLWSFGDGGSSTLQDPSHTYSTAGAYTPTVTVTDSASATAMATLGSITVGGSSSLLVSSSANVAQGPAPLTVQFAGAASGGSGSYTYSWAFGDGGSSTLQSPSYTYATEGTYQAVLTASDTAGDQGVAPAITVTVGAPLSVSLDAPATATLGNPTFFSATASGGSGTYATYTWSFGDGTGANTTVPSVTHTYAKAGLFRVWVQVADSAGNVAASSPPLGVQVVPSSYALLQGAVLNASSGTPVAGATLTLWDARTIAQAPARTTGANGSYRAALVPGIAFVNASAAGYVAASSEVLLQAGVSLVLDLNLTPLQSSGGNPPSGPAPPTMTSLAWWTSLSYPGLYLVVVLGIVAVAAGVVAARRRRNDLPPPGSVPPGPPPWGGYPPDELPPGPGY